MQKEELDKKIQKLLSANKHVTKKDLITFYWTRKDPNLLLNIIETFTTDGDVLYDPFLGSAPILFSIDQSEKNIHFIGSEINEMPLSFIKFNLNQLSDQELSGIKKKFIPFFEKHIPLFQYKNPRYNENITISKVIIDRESSNSRAKKFIFTGKDKVILSKGDDGFDECEKEYLARYKKTLSMCKNQDIELITNSRIAVKEGMMLSHLFNPINFYLLKQYTREFHDDKIMMNILSSVLHLCRLTDLKSQSQFPYWVPKKDIVERNILLLILKKIDGIIKDKKHNTLNLAVAKNFRTLKNKKSVMIINKPSQSIIESDIPDKSVDCVITDPPYFDQVAYSEYLKIWEHICNLKSNLKDEIILSNRKLEPSSEEQYLTNLTRCFTVVGNKLKDDGIAIIFFKDSKPNNIYLFLKAMESSNFSFLRSLHIGNKKYTYKQNTTKETTVSGECLFFFEKNNGVKKSNIQKTDARDSNNIKERTNEVVREFSLKYILENKKATLGELYDNGLLLALYKNDLLSQIISSKTVIEILNKNFTLLEDRNYVIEQ